jgi:hypothetical protein
MGLTPCDDMTEGYGAAATMTVANASVFATAIVGPWLSQSWRFAKGSREHEYFEDRHAI